MKILIVTTRFPYALGKPDSFTVYHLIKYLAQNHQVSLVSFIEDQDERDAMAEIESLCQHVTVVPHSSMRGKLNVLKRAWNLLPMQVNYFHSNEFANCVDAMFHRVQPDLLYCHLMRTAPYGLPYKIPKILALQISHILNYKRLISHARDKKNQALYYFELLLVKRYEPRIAEKFTRCLLISTYDKAAIDPDDKLRNIFFSPHGVDTEFFSRAQTSGPDQPEPMTLIFPADFSPQTNRDAADWLLSEIFPIIRSEIPDAHLILAGRNPPKSLLAAAANYEHIEVTGFVEDIRPYYKRASVLIDPIRACAGLQNKILTGLSMEVPVVATTAANEGIQATPNQNILLADSHDANGIAQHVITLLRDSNLRRELAENGREFVTTYWTWEHHFHDLEKLFHELVETQSSDNGHLGA